MVLLYLFLVIIDENFYQKQIFIHFQFMNNMNILQNAAIKLLNGLSKTEKFSVAVNLMKQMLSTHVIALQTNPVDAFSNKLREQKMTFEIQIADFLEVFMLLDRESQETFIKQLKFKQNG